MSDTGNGKRRRADDDTDEDVAGRSRSATSHANGERERADENTAGNDGTLPSDPFRTYGLKELPSGRFWPSFSNKTVTLKVPRLGAGCEELFTVDEQLFFEACKSPNIQQHRANGVQAIIEIPSTLPILKMDVLGWLMMLYNPKAKPADLLEILEATHAWLTSGNHFGRIWVIANHFGDWQGQNRVMDTLFYRDNQPEGRKWYRSLTEYIIENSALPVQSALYQWLVDRQARYYPYYCDRYLEGDSTAEFRTLVHERCMRFRGRHAPPMSASDYYVARPAWDATLSVPEKQCYTHPLHNKRVSGTIDTSPIELDRLDKVLEDWLDAYHHLKAIRDTPGEQIVSGSTNITIPGGSDRLARVLEECRSACQNLKAYHGTVVTRR